MATFPTLSIPPVYPIPVVRDDRTIATKKEAGYVQTRSRYSRVRRTWQVQYEKLTAADNVLLEAFMDTVHEGTDIFTWAHPVSGEYQVRFSSPGPSIEPSEYDGSQYLYSCSFTLIEV